MGSGLTARRSTTEASFFPGPSTNRKLRQYSRRPYISIESIAAKKRKEGRSGLEFTWRRRLHRLWVGCSLFFHRQRGLNPCYICGDAVRREEHNSEEMEENTEGENRDEIGRGVRAPFVGGSRSCSSSSSTAIRQQLKSTVSLLVQPTSESCEDATTTVVVGTGDYGSLPWCGAVCSSSSMAM